MFLVNHTFGVEHGCRNESDHVPRRGLSVLRETRQVIGILLKRTTPGDANEPGGLASKVFSAGCRRCHSEGVFAGADIQGFPDERRSVRQKTVSGVASERIGE